MFHFVEGEQSRKVAYEWVTYSDRVPGSIQDKIRNTQNLMQTAKYAKPIEIILQIFSPYYLPSSNKYLPF